MPHQDTTSQVCKPGTEEPDYSHFFDDEGEPHEWPGADAAMLFDSKYVYPEPKERRRRTGVTSSLRIAQNLELHEWVTDLRQEQCSRERVWLAQLAPCRCTASVPRRQPRRRAFHAAVAKTGVIAAGADDPDPAPPPRWSRERRPLEVHHVG